MKLFITFSLLSVTLFGNVDINHADIKELTTLKGVGTQKAKNILKYRKEHGCFATTDELVKVKGIGTKIVEKNQKELEAKKCKGR